MVKVDDIYKCIEFNKAPYIRLFDMNKLLLHTYDEGDNVQAAIEHLRNVLPMFEQYGRIQVNCATQAQRNQRYTGSFWMICGFNKPAGATQVQGPQFTPWQMPPGFVHQDVMLAKLSEIEKSITLNREIDALKRQAAERENQDPMKQMEKVAPWIMYAMGKPLEEIGKVTTYMRIGNANLQPAAAPTNTLTFKDIENLPADEKTQKFQTLVKSLEKKIPLESMIQLYDALDKDEDPNQLIQTALAAIPLLKNNTPS